MQCSSSCCCDATGLLFSIHFFSFLLLSLFRKSCCCFLSIFLFPCSLFVHSFCFHCFPSLRDYKSRERQKERQKEEAKTEKRVSNVCRGDLMLLLLFMSLVCLGFCRENSYDDNNMSWLERMLEENAVVMGLSSWLEAVKGRQNLAIAVTTQAGWECNFSLDDDVVVDANRQSVILVVLTALSVYLSVCLSLDCVHTACFLYRFTLLKRTAENISCCSKLLFKDLSSWVVSSQNTHSFLLACKSQ